MPRRLELLNRNLQRPLHRRMRHNHLIPVHHTNRRLGWRRHRLPLLRHNRRVIQPGLEIIPGFQDQIDIAQTPPHRANGGQNRGLAGEHHAIAHVAESTGRRSDAVESIERRRGPDRASNVSRDANGGATAAIQRTFAAGRAAADEVGVERVEGAAPEVADCFEGLSLSQMTVHDLEDVHHITNIPFRFAAWWF